MNLAKFYLHDPTADRILLPFADKRAVYDMYLQEMLDPKEASTWAPLGPPSKPWFYKAWQADEDCKHIKVRKTLRFSLCPECIKFIETRQHVLNDTERTAVKTAEGAHHKFVRDQRGVYYWNRNHAITNPGEALSVIIDGADQSAFGSPHLCNHSKDDDKHWKIGTNLMGALVHGRIAHGFTVLPNIKHGSNLTIEALHRVLMHEYTAASKALFTQRVLYVQLDNTSKQCKSQYVFGYFGLLVGWRLFKEILTGFLMVGHTHEDIDQFFSRLAEYLRKHNATSRIGFREAIVAAFKGKWLGKVRADDIESAANVSDFIAPFLAPMDSKQVGRELRDGITKFHQFKFSLLQGVVIMQVREWCSKGDAPWTGLVPGSTHHVLFKDDIPSPEEFARTCPPAQRSTLATNPKYMTHNAAGKVIANHTSTTRKGVEAIIANRGITGAAREDLHRCLELMESTDPLPFHWDMEMYTHHASARERNLGQAQPPSGPDLLDEGEVSQDSQSEDDGNALEDHEPVRQILHFDAEEKDPPVLAPDANDFSPKDIAIHQTRLVRLGGSDWGLARCVS
jgi:hypothetical protein